ncbi:MAG: GxxExxY protein [Bacteroidetes Order II. Incertae sedis bacterium]|nr:GxxExxY protein [Bacteroidetes Order II. bacterium]
MTLDEITYKVNGCAMKVHNTLGNGFQEVIYQRCLAIELERAGLSFGREVEQTIFYEGIEVGTRRADFVVENQIIVELKALINLEDVHLAQAKNYVVAYDFPIGLLINFGATSLQFKKVFNPKFNKINPANPKMSESGLTRLKDEQNNERKNNPANPKIN